MKKLLTLWMVICLLFSAVSVSAQNKDIEKALALFELGLLKGTGEAFSPQSLELDRYATRTEACITIVRMLGKEEKAAYQQNAHPFSDVPAWGSDAVGWLYENYLVNGVSDTYFGGQDVATVGQFATMLLRVLGYNDAAGDFSYENASAFAAEIGLVGDDAVYKWELTRRDMFDMCYRGLRIPLKNSKRMLIRKLCDEKAVDEVIAEQKGILTPPSIADAFPDVPQMLGEISVIRDGGAFRIHMETPVEHYGVRVFMQEVDGSGVREIKYQGVPYMEKGQIEYIGGGSSGYIHDIYVRGLDMGKQYEFIVIKTSSEEELYLRIGKSAAAWS